MRQKIQVTGLRSGGKGEARTALLEGPKPARGRLPTEPLARTQNKRLCLIQRTAVYGPVRTEVWEGGVARLPLSRFSLATCRRLAALPPLCHRERAKSA